MLLNFQRQFSDQVRSGLKRQTIRAAGQRKDVPRVGGTAHCYTGLRTRNTQKLGSWPIDRVEVIRMTISEDDTIDDVIVGSQKLTGTQLHDLALADGFKDWPAMSRWFCAAHAPQDFYGWVIGWAYAPADGVPADASSALAGLADWLRTQARHPCADKASRTQWTAWATAVDAACGVKGSGHG